MVTQTSVSHSGTLTNPSRNSTVFGARPSTFDVTTGPINIIISGIFVGAVVTLLTSTNDGLSWLPTTTTYSTAGTYQIIAAPIATLYRLQLTSLTSGFVNYNVWSPNIVDTVSHEITFDPVARALNTRAGIMATGGQPASNARYMGILGDSRAAFTYDTSLAPYYHYEAQGIPAWISYLTNQQVFCPPQLNFGVGGDNTTQILARTDAAIATMQGQSNLMIIIGGTNDRTTGLTATDSINNMSAIINKLLQAGITPLLIAELPRGDAVNTSKRLTSPQLDYHFQFRAWMRDKAELLFPGTVVVDCWSTIAQYDSLTGDAISGMLYDGLHLSLVGARLVANAIIPAINLRYTSPGILPSSMTGLYSAANNPRGWVNSNPMTTGTGGTTGSGYTGNTATGWLTNRNGSASGATGTITLAKVVRTNSELQQLTLASLVTGAGANPEFFIYQDISANLVAGDILEAVGIVEVDSGATGLLSATVSIQFNNTGNNEVFAMDKRDETAQWPSTVATVGTQKTCQIVVPAGFIPGTTVARLKMSVSLAVSTSCSAVIRFGSVGCRKVV